MIETRTSKRFAERRSAGDSPKTSSDVPHCGDWRTRADVSRESRDTAGGSPALPGWTSSLTWLNLVCLDAPLVAVSWLWLFARSFGIPIAHGGSCALFLTAWLIYLADRFGDSLSVDLRAATSLRQRFCLRHRTAWKRAIALVLLMDCLVVVAQLDAQTLSTGAVIGAVAFLYLILNQIRPSLWRLMPLKEVTIGFLFAAGMLAPVARGLTSAILPACLFFACLCSLNCIGIAIWEDELDAAQRRVSIATALPAIKRAFLPAMLVLASASVLLAGSASDGRSIYACIGGSVIALMWVHLFGRRIQPDTRTALADLVLLSPVAFVIGKALA